MVKIHSSPWDRNYKRWMALDWKSPMGFLPHGWSGILVILLGCFFLGQALFVGPNMPHGYDITGPRPRFALYLYLGAVVVNAVSGLLLIKRKAAANFHLPFYLGGISQVSLSWFALRFSLESTRDYHFLGVVLDQCFGIALLLVVVVSIYKILWTLPAIYQPPLLTGVLSMSLTFMYPFQLAWFGNEWFDCILNQYPYQKTGFVSYIYVPTLFANACIFFGATLYARKILPQGVAGICFFLFILGTLISTVLTQEIYISEVSTQKLFLLCGSEEENYALSLATRFLDTSTLARSVLQEIGVKLLIPPEF
jgi:hypothetical protein